MRAAGVSLESADTAVLRRYAAYLGTLRYAPATASRKLSAMRGAYAWLFARDLVPRDPAAVVPGPKQRRTLPATFKPSELDQLLDPPIGDDPRGLRDRALLELLYGSGLRASEACSLRVRDVDRGRRQIRVTGKGDKQRMVPLGGAAEQALDRYLARGRPALDRGLADRLFLSVRGRPLQPSDVRRSWSGRSAATGWRRAHRTRCGTHLPLIFWREVPISSASRRCLATHRWPRPRYTPTRACGILKTAHAHAHPRAR